MCINEFDQLCAGAKASLHGSIDSMMTSRLVDASVITQNDNNCKYLTDAIYSIDRERCDDAIRSIKMCSNYLWKERDIDAVKRCKYYYIKNFVATAAISFTATIITAIAVNTITSTVLYKKNPSTANANVRKYGMAYLKAVENNPTSFSEATRLLKKELKK